MNRLQRNSNMKGREIFSQKVSEARNKSGRGGDGGGGGAGWPVEVIISNCRRRCNGCNYSILLLRKRFQLFPIPRKKRGKFKFEFRRATLVNQCNGRTRVWRLPTRSYTKIVNYNAYELGQNRLEGLIKALIFRATSCLTPFSQFEGFNSMTLSSNF